MYSQLKILNNKEILVQEKSTPYLTFKRYNDLPYIKHCFTTKFGGVSKGIFSSLNLSFSRGDDTEAVKKNYELLCESAGFTLKNIVMSDQVHKTDVLTIDESVLDTLDNNDFSKRKLNCIDGMITNIPGVMLLTYYADCVPLYFVDTKNKAIGLSHSGWKGTVGLMGKRTVEAMKKAYNTDPKNLICAIGPSICIDCYEVSEDVIEVLNTNFVKEGIISKDSYSTDDFYYKKDNGKYQLDLWTANRAVLENAGVNPDNIITSSVCTCHHKDLLFSHRATAGKRGNLAAAIELTSS